MGNFIKEKSFKRFFHSDDDFNIIHFGYEDFAFVAGGRNFYVQNFYTWHFVISGRGRLEMGKRSYDISEGDSFFIPPDTPMRYFPDSDDPWEYVWFGFKGNAAAQYGEQLHFSIDDAVHACRHFGRVKQILGRTIDDLRSENHGYYKVLSAFYELMDLSTFEYRPRTPIQAVRELIDESYTVTDLNVERLCRDAGFSHAQMLRLFKREYGKTLQRYIIEKRLTLACELLENSDISVRSVAFSCGFSDEIHFMKTFKKHYGLTATEYRKKAFFMSSGQ